MGCLLILALLGAILFRCVWLAHRSRDPLFAAVAMGVAGVFGAQTILNIGMCLYVAPVVGGDAALFSYGGSSCSPPSAGGDCHVHETGEAGRKRQLAGRISPRAGDRLRTTFQRGGHSNGTVPFFPAAGVPGDPRRPFLSMVLPAFALFDQDDTARGDQSLPIAENFSLTTYRDVAVSGTFSAVDPEGDPLTFRVTKKPCPGAITFAEEGSARFTYTPYENKTGKDSFTYVAEDGEGNVSQPAVVSIKIQKPDTKVTYSDMAGNPAHKAAIALAERDILWGNRWGRPGSSGRRPL